LDSHFAPDLAICVHHYLATQQAADGLVDRNAAAAAERGSQEWFSNVEFSYGSILPVDLPIDKSPLSAAMDFLDIVQKYSDIQDPSLKNEHIEEGGTDDASLGFAGCALPLVLEHNTPNNSVALLWAETPGADARGGEPPRNAMRPLFRRRERHS
jgi:hypothetical protein